MPLLNYKVCDKTSFLSAVIKGLLRDSRISFEGDLRTFRLSTIDGASEEETPLLRRNTISPRQDFVTLPLSSSTAGEIMPAIGGSVSRKILHIQIVKSGNLEFGAYDNFHPGLVQLGATFDEEFIDKLLADGILGTHRLTRS
jgi:hypothetical protein